MLCVTAGKRVISVARSIVHRRFPGMASSVLPGLRWTLVVVVVARFLSLFRSHLYFIFTRKGSIFTTRPGLHTDLSLYSAALLTCPRVLPGVLCHNRVVRVMWAYPTGDEVEEGAWGARKDQPNKEVTFLQQHSQKASFSSARP